MEVAMTCPHCGAENPPTVKFCGQCGTSLSLSCPRCGVANPPGFKFCGQCGTPLTPAPSPSTTAAPLSLEQGFARLQQAMPATVRDQLLSPAEGENRLLT